MFSNPHKAPKTRKADPPFDDPEADVIVRSADNVDFHVFKSLLAYSSSVFKDMFCVAQGKPGNGETKDGLQVIFTSDTAKTWKILLRFLYPSWAVGPPALNSLDEFSMAMESSRKYGMMGVEKMIAADLIAPCFVEKEVMRVFALACQFGLDTEARVAARQTLWTPILGRPYFVEMENITAATYHRLQEYHIRCGKVARKVAIDTKWIKKKTFVWFDEHHTPPDGNDLDHLGVAEWWLDYMQSAAKVLKARPLGLTVSGPDLMGKALKNASKCSRCCTRAVIDMIEFKKMFEAEVDKAIAEVSFIPFGIPLLDDIHLLRLCLKSSSEEIGLDVSNNFFIMEMCNTMGMTVKLLEIECPKAIVFVGAWSQASQDGLIMHFVIESR
jgi:hypothetical protein